MNERISTIIAQLSDQGHLRVSELASQLGVSEMTIRRDLAWLHAQGLVTRTHGGAIAANAVIALHDGDETAGNAVVKAAIGRVAAGMVQPGQTVLIDTGSTALEVARHLPHDIGLTVATTSLGVALALYRTPITVLLLGGILRADFPGLYGPITENILRSLRVNITFMGCDAADSVEGFYTSDLHLTNLEQTMIAIADRTVVVTESGKFGRHAFSRHALPEQVHTVVTDAGLSPQDRANLIERGVQLLIAEEGS